MSDHSMAGRKATKRGAAAEAIDSFQAVLDHAGVKPDDVAERSLKKNYSERLSNAIAVLLAARLRATGRFPTILPLADGSGRESGSASGATRKFKKTDVRYSTVDTGLELLVSIKTLNFRDAKRVSDTGLLQIGRYTKNMVRNDHELRAEAMDHHERFPYAVLVGIFFIPVDACADGAAGKSSFAHAVLTFRTRAGRREPDDPPAKFERFFIGLYEPPGVGSGRVGFFDVLDAPPRKGQPPWPDEAPNATLGGRLRSIDELVAEIVREYGIRNRSYIRWSDESEKGAALPELEPVEPVEPDEPDEPDEPGDAGEE